MGGIDVESGEWMETGGLSRGVNIVDLVDILWS